MVEQPPGGGHQHLDAPFELQGLRFHVDAAKHHRAAQLGVLGVGLDGLGHLVSELPGGQQHQCAHWVAGRRGGAVFVFEQALQQGQGEGGCFTGASLRRTHHITTL